MVVSKWLTRRAWRLESSSINYKMDEQKGEVEAMHSHLKEHARTAIAHHRSPSPTIAHNDMYDNSAGLPQIQRNQVRNLRAFHRALERAPRPAPELKK